MEERKTIEEQLLNITTVLDKLKNKDFNLYFFTLDTKGNPTAGIANIYEHVKILNDLGYNATILHEKDDYKFKADENGNGISEWLGENYANLPHVSLEKQELNISPADFIIIPEIFSNIMDQIKNFPCKKIVFSQSYDYLFELIPIGVKWNINYNFNDVITTSEKQAQYIKTLFPTIQTHVIPVSIPSYFKEWDKPKIPVVAIHTRNPSDTVKIVKSFYLQYPIYKWITFKELKGIPRQRFADELSKACLGVWVDDSAGFGTFPVEAIQCGTPVIGKIPNMVPEWLETKDVDGNMKIKDNGIWTNTTLNIPELIATYLKVWLEDAIPEDLIKNINDSKDEYTQEKQVKAIASVYGSLLETRIDEINGNLNKLKEINQ